MKKSKKIVFGNEESTLTLTPEPPAGHLTARQFIKSKSPTRRLMLELPAALHHRMKIQCSVEKVKMVDVARELFERRFPADKK